jgi:RHS repeat-associated protein
MATAPRGRVIKVTNGATVVQSRYNALGQRVKKSNGDVFMYDEDGHLIGEYSKSTGRMQREIVYLGDEPVALLTQTVTGTAPSQVVTPNVFYIFSDHLGTPRMITQATDNAIRWRWDEADPFGLQPPNENPSGLGALTFNLRMPGQYYDRESNLFYNYFRDYDPQTGRYVQSDPIGLDGGVNTYAYVGGSPLMSIDPKGLSGCRLIGLVWECDLDRNPPPVDPDQKPLPNPTPSWKDILKPSPYLPTWNLNGICKADDKSKDRERNCQALRDSVLRTCASLSGRKKLNCFAAAQATYDACMAD